MLRTSGWAVSGLLIAAAVSVSIRAGEDLPATAAPPGPVVAEKPDPEIERLIKDLGSEDYKTREKAGRDLVARAEKALPAMRAALRETDNAEVHRRLAVMVRKMDHERLVAPKRVTTHLKDKTVKQALDEIAKQTGYKIEFGGGGGSADERHAFEFDGTPFWVAVDQVAAAAGCVVFSDYDDETIRVYNQDSLNPFVAYAGPFRFLATNIHSNKSVQLSGLSRRGGGQYRNEYMNLSFQIQSEPKNPMLGVMQAEVISAVDEFGGSLVPPKNPHDRSNYYNNGGFRGHNTYGNLNLARGDKTATTIKSLKARVGIVLLAGTAPEIVVAEPLKVKNKTFVGRTLELEYGTLTEDPNTKGNYVLEVTCKKLGASDPDGRNEDYNWSNYVWQKIDLVDAAGNSYRSYGPNTINNNGTVVQMTIPYGAEDRRGNRTTAKLGPPVKVVVNEWLSVTHEVTFEFKDIPLP